MILAFRVALMLMVCLGAADLARSQGYYYDVEPDSLKSDSAQSEIEAVPEPELDLSAQAAQQALLWTRRVIYRGFPEFTTTGSWARYAESAWNRSAGSYGPVKAHFTVNYLGPVSWLGKTAEHLQFVYRTLEVPKYTVEVDVVLSTNGRVEEVLRALYRIDKGELQTADFAVSDGSLDYDKLDHPKPGEPEELKMYSGTYQTTVYAGTGPRAAKVYAYRATGIPPFNLVVLGYGESALVFKKSGDGAEARFDAPAPSIR